MFDSTKVEVDTAFQADSPAPATPATPFAAAPRRRPIAAIQDGSMQEPPQKKPKVEGHNADSAIPLPPPPAVTPPSAPASPETSALAAQEPSAPSIEDDKEGKEKTVLKKAVAILKSQGMGKMVRPPVNHIQALHT